MLHLVVKSYDFCIGRVCFIEGCLLRWIGNKLLYSYKNITVDPDFMPDYRCMNLSISMTRVSYDFCITSFLADKFSFDL